MTSNVANQTPFLRTSRDFPEDQHQLSVELTRSYIDIASKVNSRIISLFPVNRPVVNGEEWFVVNNQKQQALRQVYYFTSTSSINHNIGNVTPGQFIRCFGSYTDATNSYGLIFGTNGGTIPNQISFYVTSTQIVFEVDAGAPSLTAGVIVLEWLSAP
jgi:hypothetical protein